MRTIITGLAVLSATLAPSSLAAATSVTANDVSWLAGCWNYVAGEAGSGEQWTAPAGGTLLGAARTVRGGRTVSHEFLIIRDAEGEGLEYEAHPSGQASTVFRLESDDPRRLVFANPDHDFPQRIIYHLQPDGVLAARIEGKVSGKERAVDFSMTRTECPGADSADG